MLYCLQNASADGASCCNRRLWLYLNSSRTLTPKNKINESLEKFYLFPPYYIDAQPTTGPSLSIYQIEATLPTSTLRWHQGCFRGQPWICTPRPEEGDPRAPLSLCITWSGLIYSQSNPGRWGVGGGEGSSQWPGPTPSRPTSGETALLPSAECLPLCPLGIWLWA